MAVYKVIQDIEAEDKLIGPLTLKGFIYALITGFLIFIEIKIALSSFGPLKWVFVFILFFPAFLFGVLASPLGREQPTEIWLLSRVQFFLKPRSRIWNQNGITELVKITAPPKIDKPLTKDLSQTEVQGRLKALAMTLDSRGWAVKNVALNTSPQPSYYAQENSSDRLIDASSITQASPVIDVRPADDIMDEQNNPRAEHMEGLMQQADAQRKKSIIDKVDEARKEVAAAASPPTPTPISEKTAKKPASTKTSAKPAATKTFKEKTVKPPSPVTGASQAVKLDLAQNASGLSVASIARLANHAPKFQQISPNEGVLSLH